MMRALIFILLVCTAMAHAIPSPSWEGLVGLYTLPTAETLPDGCHLALTYSEIRFSEANYTQDSRDTWFTGSLTVMPLPGLEVAMSVRHDLLETELIGAPFTRSSTGEHYTLLHMKYQLLPPGPTRLGLAIGAQDLTGVTRHGFDGAVEDRGRRFFLVGTYDWATLGLTLCCRRLGVHGGVQWALTDTIDLLAEYNTRPLFIMVTPRPANKANFNLGLRLYPRQVPGLRIDTTAVGDGRFDFGFSFAYVFCQ